MAQEDVDAWFGQIGARAATLVDHPALARAASAQYLAIARHYSVHGALGRQLCDAGSFAVAALLVGAGRPIPLGQLGALVTATGLASRNRITAILARLERLGAIERPASTGDRRQRPVVPTPQLLACLDSLFAAMAEGLAPVGVTRAPAPGARAFLEASLACLGSKRILLAPGAAQADVLDAMGGHLLHLAILATASPSAAGTLTAQLSLRRLAAETGLSRAHFAAVLARAEARGAARRLGNGRIALSPAFHAQLGSLLALLLAWQIEIEAAAGRPMAMRQRVGTGDSPE